MDKTTTVALGLLASAGVLAGVAYYVYKTKPTIVTATTKTTTILTPSPSVSPTSTVIPSPTPTTSLSPQVTISAVPDITQLGGSVSGQLPSSVGQAVTLTNSSPQATAGLAVSRKVNLYIGIKQGQPNSTYEITIEYGYLPGTSSQPIANLTTIAKQLQTDENGNAQVIYQFYTNDQSQLVTIASVGVTGPGINTAFTVSYQATTSIGIVQFQDINTNQTVAVATYGGLTVTDNTNQPQSITIELLMPLSYGSPTATINLYENVFDFNLNSCYTGTYQHTVNLTVSVFGLYGFTNNAPGFPSQMPYPITVTIPYGGIIQFPQNQNCPVSAPPPPPI
ncbi:MAG: hypothetical protein QXJ23_10660 [Thermofilum sp.]|uniref:hypothetical protein n=1 Tax=Thermofilum sp. TaxID=1961369 RepID=UPI00317978D3